MPDLDFRIENVDILSHAAVPTLLFKLHIENRTDEQIRSIMLRVQVQIQTVQRPYDQTEQARLRELFGEPARWSTTLKPLLWTQTVLLVPAFCGSTQVDLPIPCTYDFDVVSAKYFHALQEGEIPLEFLFSGTIFYAGGAGLQVVQIPWDKEAHHRFPLGLWQVLMEHYFPNSAWLRLRRDAFDRLYEYKVRHDLATWEATVQKLLAGALAPAQPPLGRAVADVPKPELEVAQ